MKKIAIVYIKFAIFIVLLKVSNISASEPKTLVQDILTNSANRWKELHLLPSQLIGSIILHNHPIVPFILKRVHVVSTLKGHSYRGRINSAAFNSSGDIVIVSQISDAEVWRNAAKLWDTNSGKCLHTLKGHTKQINSVKFNVSGDRIITASRDKTAKLWETRSGKCLHTLKGHTNWIRSAEFNSSGDMVLTASADKTAKLWETKSGRCLQTLEHDESVESAVFNGSGDRVLTGSDDGTVKLWETNSGECLHTLKGHARQVKSAAFNSSGDMILTCSNDGTARLWNTSCGNRLLRLTGHTDIVNSAVFDDSGDMVLTTSRDKTAKLWETRSGKCLHTLTVQTNRIGTAKFNGSGDRVITVSPDKTIARLWETESGECLHTIMDHTRSVNFASLYVSGDIILTTRSDGTVRLYDISQFLKLRSFFSRDDSISLNQAVVLIGIYEIIICRRLIRKTVSSHKLYFRRFKDTLKNLTDSTEGQALSSDLIVFDFRTCSHLQADYEKLPRAVQKILDEYVRKAPSKNDCSTASTTDEKSVSSASTSEQL